MGKIDGKYNELLNAEINEFHPKYNIGDIFLFDCDYYDWFVPPLESDVKVPLMPPLEGNEEVKKRKRNQNLNFKQTINQIFSIISINKSCKQFIQTKKRNQTNSAFTLLT